MAKVRLTRRDLEQLPRICMRCGAEADTEKRRNFSWFPSWTAILLLAGILPYIIVVAILTKRMVVYVPFCRDHKNHWLSRNLLVWLTFFGLLAVGIGVAVIASSRPGQRAGGDDMMGLVCVGMALFFLVWLILVVIAQQTAIRPTNITDRHISLTNVSEEFAEAMQRGDSDEDDWDRRPRRRPPPLDDDDWDDHDRGERRRRPPRDSYRDED